MLWTLFDQILKKKKFFFQSFKKIDLSSQSLVLELTGS